MLGRVWLAATNLRQWGLWLGRDEGLAGQRQRGVVQMIEQYGLVFGLVLLVAVVGLTVAIGARAENSIRRFREEHHEPFLGGDK